MSEASPDQVPRPLHVLRTLAETAARLIVKADTPELPAELPQGTLQLLAGAYIELRDQVRALHDMVDQTDPNDPIGTALTRVGLARRPPDREPGPRLVLTPIAPERVAAMRADELLSIYCGVMREIASVFVKYETYVVRLWDGMDGCWTNCTGDVGQEEALRYWAERTDGGARRITFDEIDYYRIFPGGARMQWDGSEGREMHR